MAEDFPRPRKALGWKGIGIGGDWSARVSVFANWL